MPSENHSSFRLAILGLLAESPLHGYELRRRLTSTLGSLRVFSYGSLYPALRRLQTSGDITSDPDPDDPTAARPIPSRSRVIYRLTPAGRLTLADLLEDSGQLSTSDDGFEVHLAFFSRTTSEARLRILQSRRCRLEERLERLRAALAKAADRMDAYTDQLRRLGLASTEAEVRWLGELINTETRALRADAETSALRRRGKAPPPP